MAASKYPTSEYTSDQFVESCGAVLFDLEHSPRQVCVIKYAKSDEWLLPKGRRNIGECRHQAALREVREETGFKCHLHPVTMPTRAPRSDDVEDIADEARLCPDLDEAFMLTVRNLGETAGVKLIWWVIAAVDHSEPEPATTSKDFEAEFLEYDKALGRLEFQTDREVLTKAIDLVEGCWRPSRTM